MHTVGSGPYNKVLKRRARILANLRQSKYNCCLMLKPIGGASRHANPRLAEPRHLDLALNQLMPILCALLVLWTSCRDITTAKFYETDSDIKELGIGSLHELWSEAELKSCIIIYP